MRVPVKLELGAGHRGTRGYLHNDINPFVGIDVVGPSWLLDFDDESLDEVLAIAFIEHLTYYEALDTFRNVRRMLSPGGLFLFDVPDYPVWAQYYLDTLADRAVAIPLDHIRRTLFGWGRWPGDEHKFGWDRRLLTATLRDAGFRVDFDVQPFIDRAHRDRFHVPSDAHLYAVCK